MKGKVGGQWNKIFMEFYRSILHGFLHFSPVSLSELCSFWYGLKDLFTLHKSEDKFVERMRIRTGGYGRLGAVTGGYGRLGAVTGGSGANGLTL